MSTSEFISLAGGLTLPWPAIETAIDLELAGFTMSASEGRLRLTPPPSNPELKVSAQDRERIIRWRSHLLALVAYKPPTPRWQTKAK